MEQDQLPAYYTDELTKTIVLVLAINDGQVLWTLNGINFTTKSETFLQRYRPSTSAEIEDATAMNQAAFISWQATDDAKGTTVPELYKMMVVSTGMFREEEVKQFNDIAYYTADYGCLINLEMTTSLLADNSDLVNKVSDSSRELLFDLHTAGVQYLALDCDGPEIPGYPTYDW